MVTPEDKKKHTRRTILLAGISCAMGAVVNYKIRDETLKEGYLIYDNILGAERALPDLIKKYNVKRIAIADLPSEKITLEKLEEMQTYNQANSPFGQAWNQYKTEFETWLKDNSQTQYIELKGACRQIDQLQRQVLSPLKKYSQGEFAFEPFRLAKKAIELGINAYGIEQGDPQPHLIDRIEFAQLYQTIMQRISTIDLCMITEHEQAIRMLTARNNALTLAVQKNGLSESPPNNFGINIPHWIESTIHLTPILLCTYGGATNQLINYLNEHKIPARHDCCEQTARKV